MAELPTDLAGLLQNGYRYALALTHDEGLADELLQEACLSMLTARASWDERYLVTAIRTRHIDHHRRRRSQRFAMESANHVLRLRAEDAAQPSATRQVHEDQSARLHEALGRLRSEEREALFLHIVAGHSAGRIATLTGRPRSTVLSLLQRGRHKLSAMLSQDTSEACSNG